MEEKLKKFKQLLAQITDLSRASAVLGWDQQVYMPRGGAIDRGNILATMAGITHDRFTSDEMGKL
jgi:carboxypeptidase Taq